jgi:hypothetical protein
MRKELSASLFRLVVYWNVPAENCSFVQILRDRIIACKAFGLWMHAHAIQNYDRNIFQTFYLSILIVLREKSKLSVKLLMGEVEYCTIAFASLLVLWRASSTKFQSYPMRKLEAKVAAYSVDSHSPPLLSDYRYANS